MGGGNGQKSRMARERNMEKAKGAKGSQLETNKKAMNIQAPKGVTLCLNKVILDISTGCRGIQAMEASNKKAVNRDAITEEVAAAFAESNVIPERYYRPDEVNAGIVVGYDDDEAYELPVVDMGRLLDPELAGAEIAKLGSACRDWGFFQLVSHGIDEQVVNEMKDSTARFFSLPLESKKTVAVRENGIEGFGHHYSRVSGKLDWAESVILFSVEMTSLTMRIVGFMAADLGVEQEALVRAFRDSRQNMLLHHYPPCRLPDKVIGITPHTDGLSLTVLLQVDDTPGLQIKKDGRWFPVRPRQGTFIINVANILEVLTNGAYRSVEHRVLIHARKSRTTVVMFHDAHIDGMVQPIQEVLKHNGAEARYRSIEKLEYMKGHFSCKVCMQTFMCTTSEVKCREHAEAKHPKTDVYQCFPQLKK
uniref:Fe2OG dioxygenase domain-containing protein n=1 Tax=Oryza glumipatula TaxID=40148 RepID=A0A0D9Z9D6_9ORYZ